MAALPDAGSGEYALSVGLPDDGSVWSGQKYICSFAHHAPSMSTAWSRRSAEWQWYRSIQYFMFVSSHVSPAPCAEHEPILDQDTPTPSTTGQITSHF